jgi:hypothetical protein
MLSSSSEINDFSSFILCCYTNNTSSMQIARITNIANWYFERVILPGQRLIFESPSEAELEIHTNTNITAILADKIQCQSLEMNTTISILSYEKVSITNN